MPRTDTKGLVEIYTGNGKGKTSAAIGVALRAIGYNQRVHIIYFMKGNGLSGEQMAMARLPGITYSKFGQPEFVDPENITVADKEEAQKAFAAAEETILNGNYDLVILDEINIAVAWKLIGLEAVIDLIKRKPEKLELILTGRYANTELIKLSDLVTEMLDIKHPYSEGILARQGIDY